MGKEATAIRDTAERSRNKDRVVYPAKAGEDLVILSEVEVDPNIKGVAMLIEAWAGCKIGKDAASCGRRV